MVPEKVLTAQDRVPIKGKSGESCADLEMECLHELVVIMGGEFRLCLTSSKMKNFDLPGSSCFCRQKKPPGLERPPAFQCQVIRFNLLSPSSSPTHQILEEMNAELRWTL